MNILFIDDDPEDIGLFTEILQDIDPDIRCSSITSSLQLETEFKQLATPDIVFLDGHLEPLTPNEALRILEILIDPKRTKVYILTGSISVLEAKDYQQAGITGVLLKGLSYNEIRDNFLSVIREDSP